MYDYLAKCNEETCELKDACKRYEAEKIQNSVKFLAVKENGWNCYIEKPTQITKVEESE